MREFLEVGDKLKVNIRFRGREMSHQELGREMAARIEADLGEDIVIESRPRLEGRQMVMMIAPKKKQSPPAGRRYLPFPSPAKRGEEARLRALGPRPDERPARCAGPGRGE